MSADLSKYCQIIKVKKDLPDQHLDVGMAEQNLISVAAGVAKAGFVPIATTFACYATRRAYDQMMICMGTGPLTSIVIGFTPGIANPARIHHQAAEDLGMIRAIPDTTVIDPMDATEFQQALDVAVDTPGLVYLRGHRGNTPRLLDAKQYKFVLGKTYPLVKGDNIGIVATGHATQWALEASEILTQKGVSHSLLHVPTIKPVKEQEIADFCFAHKSIVTIENHQIVTGLARWFQRLFAIEVVGQKSPVLAFLINGRQAGPCLISESSLVWMPPHWQTVLKRPHHERFIKFTSK